MCVCGMSQFRLGGGAEAEAGLGKGEESQLSLERRHVSNFQRLKHEWM